MTTARELEDFMSDGTDPIERAAQAVIGDLSLVWSDDEAPALADARNLARAVLANIDRDDLARVLGDANDAWNRPDGTDVDDMRDLDDYQADAILTWLRGEPRG